MNLLEDLNKEQKQAVIHDEGPLLIVAGAGTGKTTVITRRIAYLIEKGLAQPDEILALTFTEKAAGEMEERVDRLLPYGYFELWVSTFHSFCERILRHHAIDIGLPNNFKLASPTDAWLLVRKNLRAFDLDYYRPLGNPTKFIHELLKHFSRAKDECVTPEEYLNYAQNLKLDKDLPPPEFSPSEGKRTEADELKRFNEVANAYHAYQNLLINQNAFDFGDLINYALKLFKERPTILENYRQQFKYILIDEFQDTNIAQYELIKLLASPKNNLTVVGDDDQSIYKFRGASISNILAFRKDFPNAREVFLTQNYRSRQNILDLSYKFIQLNNPYRLEYQLTGIQKAESPRQNPEGEQVPSGAGKFGAGQVRIGNDSALSKRLLAQNTGEGAIECIHARTHFDEAREVVDKIVELKEKNDGPTAMSAGIAASPPTFEESEGLLAMTNKKESAFLTATQSVSWNDFAILVRANDHADLFIRELADRGVPYQFLASRGLYSKPIILDVLAYLKLLDNYHESPAMFRVLNLPPGDLSEAAKIELTHHASRKSISLYSAMRQAGALGLDEKDVKKVNLILSLIQKHTRLASRAKVSAVILAFLNESGYLKWLTSGDDRYRLDLIMYLNYFWREAQRFEAESAEPTAKNFLELISLKIEAGEEGGLPNSLDEGPEAVKILTIHSAKGLEFKYVFLVNLVDQRFPTRERKEAIALPDALVREITPAGDIHLQEERRLFYVACTRAKEGLFLSRANDYGGARLRKPSRFLFESGLLSRTDSARINTDNPRINQKISEPAVNTSEPSLSISESSVISSVGHPLPAKLSFTQIKAFETCPLQYKFAHILRVPTRGRPSFSFGKSIHAALEKFFRTYKDRSSAPQMSLLEEARIPNQSFDAAKDKEFRVGRLVSLEEMLKAYEESFIDDWYDSPEQKEEYYNKGKKALARLYESTADTSPNVQSLEQPFTIKIGNLPFKGKIDRVDKLPDGSLEIIDYKTGLKKEADKTDKAQLVLYDMAARELFHEPVGRLTYWYVESGDKITFKSTDEEMKDLREQIIETAQAMKVSAFPATPSQFKCRHCDFRDICEFRII